MATIMEGIVIAFLIACGSTSFEYVKQFLEEAWIFKTKYTYWIGGVILTVLEVKPFSCSVCLSIWISVLYALIFDINFLFYIGVAPVLTEGIDRHLKFGL